MPDTAWTILCDFDGTITIDDVTDALLERLGRPGWEQLESDWRRGRIGSRECMAGQIELIEGNQVALDAVIDSIAIDPDFARFAALAASHGVALTILSDGIDYAITRILEALGIGSFPIIANALSRSTPDRWQLSFPHAQPHCASGNCKCASAAREASAGRATLLIGDGLSDVCIAQHADFVFAKDRLLLHCRDAGLAHRPISGFADACALLPALLSGQLDVARNTEIPFLTRVQYA